MSKFQRLCCLCGLLPAIVFIPNVATGQNTVPLVVGNSILAETTALEGGEVVLGSQTSTFRFRADATARAHNVRLATRRVNGAVIRPGETWSFNTRVGPRTRAAGFLKAHTIIAGELTDTYGGGTCQVASMTYASAIKSGLTILTTRSHSRYMHYLDPGLDSTVAYRYYDLVIRNDFPFPVTLEARESSRGTLTFFWRGARRIYDVQISVVELDRREHGTTRVLNSTLRPGRHHVSEQGTDYLVIRRTIRYVPLSPEMIEQVFIRTIQYDASDRIWEYNPL